MITLRPWLDRLLLATLVVTTWHKLHWSPGAGDVTLEDILAAGFVGALRHRSLPARATGACTASRSGCCWRWACSRPSTWAATSRSRTAQELSQYAKGMTKFALHFGFLVCGHAVRDRPRRAHAAAQRSAPSSSGSRSTAPTAWRSSRRRSAPGSTSTRPSSARSRSGRAASAASTSTGRRRRCSGQLRLARRLPRERARARPQPPRDHALPCRSCCCCRSRCATGCAARWGALLAALRGGLRRRRAAHAVALGHARPRLRPARPRLAIAPATARAAPRRARARRASGRSASCWPPRPTRARSSARA